MDAQVTNYVHEQLKELNETIKGFQNPYEKTMARFKFLEVLLMNERMKDHVDSPAPVVTRENLVERPAENPLPAIQQEEVEPTPTKKVSADFASKKLKMEEIDDIWTDELLQNEEFKKLYDAVTGFFITGYRRQMFTEDWLDKTLSEYTEGKIKHFNQPKADTPEAIRAAANQIPPNLARFILSFMKQAFLQHRGQAA